MLSICCLLYTSALLSGLEKPAVHLGVYVPVHVEYPDYLFSPYQLARACVNVHGGYPFNLTGMTKYRNFSLSSSFSGFSTLSERLPNTLSSGVAVMKSEPYDGSITTPMSGDFSLILSL